MSDLTVPEIAERALEVLDQRGWRHTPTSARRKTSVCLGQALNVAAGREPYQWVTSADGQADVAEEVSRPVWPHEPEHETAARIIREQYMDERWAYGEEQAKLTGDAYWTIVGFNDYRARTEDEVRGVLEKMRAGALCPSGTR